MMLSLDTQVVIRRRSMPRTFRQRRGRIANAAAVYDGSWFM
jgi:hypothetical protein